MPSSQDARPPILRRSPLVPGRVLMRWLLPGLALLLWIGATARFVTQARSNPPPVPLLQIPGFEHWADRALFRRRCAFAGQFLAVDESVFTLCALSKRRWELLKWNLPKGRAERLWPVDAMPGEVRHVSGLHHSPAVAAALRHADGRLSLVVHGFDPQASLRLIVVHPAGGVVSHGLPGLLPGSLAGFTARHKSHEMVTADGRLHRLDAKGALGTEPLPGLPPGEGVTVELAEPLTKGWRVVYSTAPSEERPAHYPLFVINAPGAEPLALGTLRDAPEGRTGERVDLSPGNVLPVFTVQWPTHRLEDRRIVPLAPPPESLLDGLPPAQLLGTQVIRLHVGRQERLFLWSSLALENAPQDVQANTASATGLEEPRPSTGRAVERWRWYLSLPHDWLAVESARHALHLRRVPAAAETRLSLSRPPVMPCALPDGRGGIWIFDSQGSLIRLASDLSWKNRPGLWARLGRLWRREHLEPGALTFQGNRLLPPDRWIGLADRWALPALLFGWPILLALGFLSQRLSGQAASETTPRSWLLPRAPIFAASLIYLALSILLLWRFWVTTALL